MKRLICILLLLALLTGCAAPGSTGDTCRTEDPVEAEKEAAQDPQPEKTPEPEPEDVHEPVEEPEPSGTTAGGVTVHTDYSNYTPRVAEAPRYTRLTEEFIPDLQPSDGCGMLYPFVGSLLYSVGTNGYSYQAGETYGLMDETGRIVADATYMEISVLSYYDSMHYQTVEVPMLRLSRAGEATLIEMDGWSYIDGYTLYGLASFDGKFVLPCEYGHVSAFACGVLVMDDYQADAFTIYDFEGNVLLTERDLAIDAGKLTDWSYGSLQYSEGCFTIELADGRWVMDLDGSLLHGPYYNIGTYSNGVAAASADAEHYGFVDYAGNWVVEPKYDWAYSAEDGSCICRSETGMMHVFDAQGAERFSVKADYLEVADYGYRAGSYSSQFAAHYDRDGELIRQESESWYQVDYRGSVYYRETNGGLELFNVSTGAQAVLENADYLHTIYAGGMDFVPLDVPYISLTRTDGSLSLISKEDFSTVLELSPGGWVSGAIDPVTGSQYLCEQAGGAFRLYDESLRLIGTYDSAPYLYNGMIRTTDDRFCTWQDVDGSVIFRYSLAASLSD